MSDVFNFKKKKEVTEEDEFPLSAPPQAHFLHFVPKGNTPLLRRCSPRISRQAFSCRNRIPFKAASPTQQLPPSQRAGPPSPLGGGRGRLPASVASCCLGHTCISTSEVGTHQNSRWNTVFLTSAETLQKGTERLRAPSPQLLCTRRRCPLSRLTLAGSGGILGFPPRQ